jgi:hypothetical protein
VGALRRHAVHGRGSHLRGRRPGKTKYTAKARHWSKEACEQHKAMGFHPGWTQCARQLEDVAKTI